ncbi:hypothetical protein [Microlunatus sp. Gsoil 973]|uniref:hypothetical protein n=1 Tax=Microlunatus sp. Gsoil 973 TaxID=2672569 RepID=UPI0012B4A22D|nr:hypothetical protein [Microlunatus sp. Gsoil 973]QGN32515.1 hypothetical protein GJV80_06540 [Microlunatus sp. Gsoil 973]
MVSSAGRPDGVGVADVETEVTETERAVLQVSLPAEILRLFSGYTQETLGSSIARVRFRSGRIDVVWGVELTDGRKVAVKAHRRPVDLGAVTAATQAQQTLSAVGFPCAEPLSGPDEMAGQVLRVETLLPDGQVADGRDPVIRRLLADGLAGHIDVLRHRSDLIDQAGSGPSWCQYQAGPWPVPHDPIVDFTATPLGYRWLDRFAEQAADQILTHRDAGDVVVGHADWYVGNVAVADGKLVATYDWELVADTEAVIAGFTAACYGASCTDHGR